MATTHTGSEDLQPSVSPGWPSIVNHLEPWPSWHPGFYSLPRTHSFPFPSTLPLLFKIACCDLAQPRGMAAEGSARVSWCGAWCLCRPLWWLPQVQLRGTGVVPPSPLAWDGWLPMGMQGPGHRGQGRSLSCLTPRLQVVHLQRRDGQGSREEGGVSHASGMRPWQNIQYSRVPAHTTPIPLQPGLVPLPPAISTNGEMGAESLPFPCPPPPKSNKPRASMGKWVIANRKMGEVGRQGQKKGTERRLPTRRPPSARTQTQTSTGEFQGPLQIKTLACQEAHHPRQPSAHSTLNREHWRPLVVMVRPAGLGAGRIFFISGALDAL